MLLQGVPQRAQSKPPICLQEKATKAIDKSHSCSGKRNSKWSPLAASDDPQQKPPNKRLPCMGKATHDHLGARNIDQPHSRFQERPPNTVERTFVTGSLVIKKRREKRDSLQLICWAFQIQPQIQTAWGNPGSRRSGPNQKVFKKSRNGSETRLSHFSVDSNMRFAAK